MLGSQREGGNVVKHSEVESGANWSGGKWCPAVGGMSKEQRL